MPSDVRYIAHLHFFLDTREKVTREYVYCPQLLEKFSRDLFLQVFYSSSKIRERRPKFSFRPKNRMSSRFGGERKWESNRKKRGKQKKSCKSQVILALIV